MLSLVGYNDKIMKLSFLVQVLFILLATSCSSDYVLDEIDKGFYKNPSFKIDGKYDVVSFTSEAVVDLNGDGNYTNDLLKEADQWKNAEQYFVQFITERDYNDTTVYVPKLFLWAPYCGVITQANSNKFLYRDFSFTNLLARCYYSEAANNIKIWNGNLGEGQIISATINGDLMIVNFIQSYYTANGSEYIESGWKRLKITGIYKKRKI